MALGKRREASETHTESARQSYEKLAGIYDDKWKKYVDSTLHLILKTIQLGGWENVLDVACGTGELEKRLIDKWPHLEITGVDLSEAMLERARSKPFGSRVEWIQGDVRTLPFPNESFDIVVCASAFHYFPSPQESLAQMHRILKPDGRLVLVDWCDDYLSCKLCSMWLRWKDPAFYKTYSLQEAERLLSESGFSIMSAAETE